MHIISTDEGQVFAAVQEWNQNDTYNIYISDPQGIYFTLALENVKASRSLGGNSMIDLYEVRAFHRHHHHQHLWWVEQIGWSLSIGDHIHQKREIQETLGPSANKLLTGPEKDTYYQASQSPFHIGTRYMPGAEFIVGQQVWEEVALSD